jgi:hypothetical protein
MFLMLRRGLTPDLPRETARLWEEMVDLPEGLALLESRLPPLELVLADFGCPGVDFGTID